MHLGSNGIVAGRTVCRANPRMSSPSWPVTLAPVQGVMTLPAPASDERLGKRQRLRAMCGSPDRQSPWP